MLEYLPNKHKAQYWQKKGRKEGQEGGREKREGGREGKKPKGIEKFSGAISNPKECKCFVKGRAQRIL